MLAVGRDLTQTRSGCEFAFGAPVQSPRGPGLLPPASPYALLAPRTCCLNPAGKRGLESNHTATQGACWCSKHRPIGKASNTPLLCRHCLLCRGRVCVPLSAARPPPGQGRQPESPAVGRGLPQPCPAEPLSLARGGHLQGLRFRKKSALLHWVWKPLRKLTEEGGEMEGVAPTGLAWESGDWQPGASAPRPASRSGNTHLPSHGPAPGRVPLHC